MNSDNTSIAKGLDALFRSEVEKDVNSSEKPTDDRVQQIPLDNIIPGLYQPRIHFDEKPLQELSESIKENGLLQPVLLRKTTQGSYELIAGERRWRACKMAGLKEIPAIVREVTEEAAAAFSLIENIQRQDLDVIEEAKALKRLHQEFQLTHEDIAKRLGKPRSSISNLLRLLHLPEKIQAFISQGKLEHGHGKLLLSLEAERQITMAELIVSQQFSVRETEKLLNAHKENTSPSMEEITQECAELSVLREILQSHFGANATIRLNKKGKGKIILPVKSLQKAKRIIAKVCEES